MKITVRKPSKEEVAMASEWPIWEKEESEFIWSYDSQETCLILEGSAMVTASTGESVSFSKGDWVVFPQGLDCKWRITKAIRKHYSFD